ncbi:MAG: haloacid dehalogenase-like hydrolase [[Eubacterium] sulci]|jgi:hypothetical protein|nr:haloacid dehalogenase-like hydrolase [[Eubacterium] sulci]MBF1147549.1 haloacid dehalogenase-like hydrolase [[Eubacterium] sulci]MBF1176293.1 haloacid dehalogenase-like hydrolase [[Eubacterium] sulci]
MANIIAVVWDFDKTLLNGYMQEPIFKYYGIDEKSFWGEVGLLPAKYMREQGVRVNPETIYLNQFIRDARDGRMQGLNNEKLKSFGKELKFYPGIPELFTKTKDFIDQNEDYRECGIKLEHYIVSTGMAAIIQGSEIAEYVDGIWGCEFIEDEQNGERRIAEIGYTVDNTTKTRAIFEINKGVNKHPEMDVNIAMPEDARRVKLKNMIYIADGPSDIPAFSVVRGNGGSTYAIYPKGDINAFKQVDILHKNDRIDGYSEADYSEGSQTYLWIMNRIESIADKICEDEKSKYSFDKNSVPKHLNE